MKILFPNSKLDLAIELQLKKKKKLKIVYHLKLSGEEKYNKYEVVFKIQKMDENNQYGQAMTKPLPTGCIEKGKKYTRLP